MVAAVAAALANLLGHVEPPAVRAGVDPAPHHRFGAADEVTPNQLAGVVQLGQRWYPEEGGVLPAGEEGKGLTPGRVGVGERLPETEETVAGVVENAVEHELHAAPLQVFDQGVEGLPAAQVRVDLVVVLGVVAVARGALENGRQVEATGAQVVQVVERLDHAPEVAAVELARSLFGIGRRSPGSGHDRLALVAPLARTRAQLGPAVPEAVGEDLIKDPPYGPVGHARGGQQVEEAVVTRQRALAAVAAEEAPFQEEGVAQHRLHHRRPYLQPAGYGLERLTDQLAVVQVDELPASGRGAHEQAHLAPQLGNQGVDAVGIVVVVVHSLTAPAV